MSVADTVMSKLYFKKSYFCEEFFVVEAFDQFRYRRNKTSKMFTVVASLYTDPVYLEHHRFELVISISLNFD